MFAFSEEYDQLTTDTWHRYIAGEDPLPSENPGIRPLVFESWRRSKEAGTACDEIKDSLLPENKLWELKQKNALLLQVAHPYIQNLYQFMKGTDFALALTDSDGYVIDLIRDDTAAQEQIKQTGLEIGCLRAESYAGTNGLCLCLRSGQPIQVSGAEHYVSYHHGHTCSAAPIFDTNDEIVGCLGAIGSKDLSYNHTLAMVSAAADGITKELKLRTAYDRLVLTNGQLRATMNSISTGILVVDEQDIITQSNSRALNMLQIEVVTGRNIFDVIQNNTLPFDRNFLESDASNIFVPVRTMQGKEIPLSISTSAVQNQNGSRAGTIIVLEKIQKLHKLTNKISGFSATYTFDGIIGASPEMQKAKEIAAIAAQSPSNVLILGESGTGKEMFAQAIHNASDRADGPFIAINCGSIPRSLLESELFGYEGGTFTGANKEGQPGKFELANGGTIFLDEIGDMPLDMQASLLRVIQSKEIVRLGGKTSLPIDVRIMAATNANLNTAIQERTFRSDLFYRLNVLSIEIPPLRQRPEDVESLVMNFLASVGHHMNTTPPTISEDVMEILRGYHWPGNVRQLENVIERAINLCQTGQITRYDLPDTLFGNASSRAAQEDARPTASTLQPSANPAGGSGIAATARRLDAEFPSLQDALQHYLAVSYGNVTKVSEIMGIPKRTLYRKIQKYGIDLERYR